MTTVKKFSEKMIFQGQPINTVKMVAEETIDFSLHNVSAADVVEVLKIPKGALVTNAGLAVITAEGATCTAKLGDAGNDDGWLPDSTDLNAVGAKLPASHTTGVYAADGGSYYAADGTLILTMGHDTDTAKITVFAEYIVLDKKYLS